MCRRFLYHCWQSSFAENFMKWWLKPVTHFQAKPSLSISACCNVALQWAEPHFYIAHCRQKDHFQTVVRTRALSTSTILQNIIQTRNESCAFSSSACLCWIARNYVQPINYLPNHLHRTKSISGTDVTFNFNAISEAAYLLHLRFQKPHLLQLVQVMGWPHNRMHTNHNRNGLKPILACFVVLRWLAAPAHWRDLEDILRKHGPQLSKILWEAIEHFVHERQHLMTDMISGCFLAPKIEKYTQSIYEKSKALPNWIGFLDGTVIGIARLKGNLAQILLCNRHKIKHAWTYQALNTPGGLIQHLHGPLEGRCQDCNLHVKEWTQRYTTAHFESRLCSILHLWRLGI